MKRRLLLAALPFALAACGFHLKGTDRQDNHVHSIHLDLPDGSGELGEVIRATLRQQGIAEDAGAAVRVSISDIDDQRVRTTTGGTGSTQEIEIFNGFRATISENGETRGNLAAGGRGVAQELSERDREIAETLAPELKRRGILLAGLDVIGSNLTEVNVTSPTGFQEIMKQKDFDAAAMFADAVQSWAAR